MHNVSGVSLTQPVLQQTMDYFSSPINLPVSKLDADQYIAEDIDGVTESLFGSGNLNFLVMQAGQTNGAVLANQSGLLSGETFSGSTQWSSATGFHSAPAAISNDFSAAPFNAGVLQHGGASFSPASSFGFGTSGGTAAATPISAAADGAVYSGVSVSFPISANGLNGGGSNGSAGSDGVAGTPGTSGQNGTPGLDGAPGKDNGGGDGTTIIEVNVGDTVINLGDINLGDINLGDVNLGDIIVNLGDLNIDLGDVITIVTDVTDVVVNIVTDVTNIVTDVTNIVTTVVTDVTDVIFDIVDGGLTLHLDAILSPVTDLDLSIISGDTVIDLLDSVIDLSPVTDLLEPIIDLDGLVLTDIHSILSLLNDGGHEHRPGDTDIGLGLDTVLGDFSLLNGVTDIALDPIEDLLGDVDVLADLGIKLFDTSGIDNGAGDTDLTLDLGLGALGGGLIDGGLDIPLDPVEAILGDIDIDLGLATNLLGQTAQGIVDEFSGGSADDTLLSGVGDFVSGIAGALLPGIGGDSSHDDVSANVDLGLLGHQVSDLGVSEALDVIEPLSGDVDVLSDITFDVFGNNETRNDLGDIDIDLDLDLDLLGVDIVEIDFIDIPLDPVEAILGDIDLNLNAALDLLNPDGNDGGIQDLLHNNSDGDGLLAWTENVLPDLGSLLGHEGDSGLNHLLPTPVGDIAEGLGGLFGSDTSNLFGGGLFG